MPGWTLTHTHPTQGHTFQRPLSTLEHAFFYDSLFNGTSDSIQHLELRLLNDAQDAVLFSDSNIRRAWTSTKRRYPLAGATVRGQDLGLGAATEIKGKGGGGEVSSIGSAADLHFVVRERDLSAIRPGEIVFGKVANAEEARKRATAILDGPRALSAELLVQLYVFHESSFENARADILHVMGLVAHCVADDMANRTLMRCFLDTLARGGGPSPEPTQMPLEERLAMTVPAVELEPTHLRSLSPVRQRWRRAVAGVIIQSRLAKMQGGQTLPCHLKHSTQSIPAQSGSTTISLTHAQSTAVMEKCRQHNLTFEHAYLVLAQVAMTRVLYRRHLLGEMSGEEWEGRKRQPYNTVSQINLRPYLDKAWFEHGGGGEFVACTSFNIDQLPFMPLGRTDQCRSKSHKHDTEHVLGPNYVPPFSKLLPFDCFMHRAGLVKRLAAGYFNHPMFLEWMKNTKTGERDGQFKVLALTDKPLVMAHGRSSLSNVDPIFPFEYPLPPTHPLSPHFPALHPMKAGYAVPAVTLPLSVPDVGMDSKIMVTYDRTRFHPRPGELHLGAVISRGQLDLCATYDINVFEERVVTEWLEEVKEAVLWYLCR